PARLVEGAAAVDRGVEAPVLADHEFLVEPEHGEGARPVLADAALVEGAAELRVLPRRNLEADPRGAGVAVLAVGDLVLGEDAEILGDPVGGADLEAGREVHAVVPAAQAEVGARVELQAAVHERAVGAQGDLARFGRLAAGGFVARPLQAGACAPAVATVGGFQARGVAHGAAGQVFEAVCLALQGEALVHAPAALHAGLGHAAFRAVLLAQAEAGVLAPRIGEQVVVVAAVLPFHQPGVAGAGAGGVAALGAGVLGADLVGIARPEARIHARQPAAAAEVLVADVGGAGLRLAVHHAHAGAAT